MAISHFGPEELQSGMLNNMLEEAGIDDVGSFVKEFRSEANREPDDQRHHSGNDEDEDEDTSIRSVSTQKASLFSMGSSLLNKFTSGGGGGGHGEDESSGNDNLDMIQGAMKAYKMFSGDKGQSGGGGGGFLDNMSSTYQNAQKMYGLYKQFDKNGDGKITAEDIEIYLQEMGLGFVSPYLSKALFQAVDQNHNGSLDFTDLMALVTLLNKLTSQSGGIPK